MAYEDMDLCLRAWEAGPAVLLHAARDAAAPRVADAPDGAGRARAGLAAVLLAALGRLLRRARRAHRRRPAARRLRDRGHRRRRRPPRHLRAPQPARRARARRAASTRWATSRTGSTCEVPVRDVQGLRVARRRAARARGASRSRRGGTRRGTVWLVVRAHRRAGLLRAGHRDVVLPRPRGLRHHVLDGYRQEFRYMTISGWNRDRLRELGLDASLIPPGIDLETFRPLPDVARREDMVLALGRSNPLKNLPLTVDAWQRARRRRARPSCACSASSPSWARSTARATSSGPATRASTSCSTRRRCSCRPRRTRASACRRSRRWPPAALSSAPTRTATATSASTASTA